MGLMASLGMKTQRPAVVASIGPSGFIGRECADTLGQAMPENFLRPLQPEAQRGIGKSPNPSDFQAFRCSSQSTIATIGRRAFSLIEGLPSVSRG